MDAVLKGGLWQLRFNLSSVQYNVPKGTYIHLKGLSVKDLFSLKQN